MRYNKNKHTLYIISLICSICIILFPLFKSNIKSSTKEDISTEVNALLDEKDLYDKLVTYKDIPYKTVGENRLTLDILMPDTSPYKEIPVVVFAHGGSWTKGEKSDFISKTKGDTTIKLLDEGYAVVSVEYSLLDGQVVFPQNISDVKDSIRWIRKNSQTYNFDSKNIGIWGTSAGAHLSLMTAYTDDNIFLGDEQLKDYSSQVNYVVDINAPVDINELLEFVPEEEIKDLAKTLFGMTIKNEELTQEQLDEVEKYFPLQYITDKTVDTLIFHGTEDITVPINQSKLLYDKLIKYGVNADFIIIEDAKHGLVPISEEDLQMVSEQTINFIKSHYIGN